MSERLDWNERCCLARVRMLALAEMSAAGGEPRPDQLRRALEPVVGDVADRLRAGSAPTDAVVKKKGKSRRQRNRVVKVF